MTIQNPKVGSSILPLATIVDNDQKVGIACLFLLDKKFNSVY